MPWGNTINTASRPEVANKYPGPVFVSRATALRCPGFIGRPVGRQRLKGKAQGIDAFEPLTIAEANASASRRYLVSYRMLEQDDAEVSFALLALQYPDNRLIGFHLRRLHDGDPGTIVVLQIKSIPARGDPDR